MNPYVILELPSRRFKRIPNSNIYVDPTKVIRVALENALSVASVLLLVQATITSSPDPEGKEKPLNEVA